MSVLRGAETGKPPETLFCVDGDLSDFIRLFNCLPWNHSGVFSHGTHAAEYLFSRGMQAALCAFNANWEGVRPLPHIKKISGIIYKYMASERRSGHPFLEGYGKHTKANGDSCRKLCRAHAVQHATPRITSPVIVSIALNLYRSVFYINFCIFHK